MKSNKLVSNNNSDNEDLMPTTASGLCTGHVDEVNGWGACEINEFVPTRYELIRLVKQWHTVYLKCKFDCFVFNVTACREDRLATYAMRRIKRIAELLGEEIVNKAMNEAEEKFAESTNPALWGAFKEDGTETKDAYWDDVEMQHQSADARLLKKMQEFMKLQNLNPSQLVLLGEIYRHGFGTELANALDAILDSYRLCHSSLDRVQEFHSRNPKTEGMSDFDKYFGHLIREKYVFLSPLAVSIRKGDMNVLSLDSEVED